MEEWRSLIYFLLLIWVAVDMIFVLLLLPCFRKTVTSDLTDKPFARSIERAKSTLDIILDYITQITGLIPVCLIVLIISFCIPNFCCFFEWHYGIFLICYYIYYRLGL